MTLRDVPACLGVERSLSGRRWCAPGADLDRAAADITRQTGVAPPLAAVLARQGVAPEAVPDFLAPTLRDLLPDPRSLRDMERAAGRLVAAAGGERVAIFADYDVDGACSAALLVEWFRALGPTPTVYVPDRIAEGYGPNAAAMARLAEAHDLVICVDCGTVAHDALAAASAADVLVFDHHQGAETLPPALAVVNPNRADEDATLGHLCAAGVVFLALVEANRQRRATGGSEPGLMALLDLVALATVADVAPLTGVNRALVRQGLRVMAGGLRPGLAALCDAAGLSGPPSGHALGYVLGPRLNAGGRIGAAGLGVRLLTAQDPARAAALAAELETLNTARRSVEADVREAALAQAEARGLEAPLAWAAGEGWHPGVVGIVAARLKEAADRPALVIGFENGRGKGSGRSVSGVDLGAAVSRLAREGLIETGGGHAMAAGLSLTRAQLEPAMTRLGALLARQGAARRGTRQLRVDGVLMVSAIGAELVAALDTGGPYGAASPAPRFAFPKLRLREARRVGTSHQKLTVADGERTCDAILFGAYDGPLGAAVERLRGAQVHLAGRLELNHWGGRVRVQIRVDDVAAA